MKNFSYRSAELGFHSILKGYDMTAATSQGNKLLKSATYCQRM
jgi:hypothetical protein